jgi:hypothetical protein
MKKILPVMILISSYAFAQTTTPDSAKYHVGEMTTICGHIYQVHLNEKGVSVLSFGDKAHNPFNAAIFAVDIHKFTDLEKRCVNKNVCVTGWIKNNGGKTQVIVTESSALTVADE